MSVWAIVGIVLGGLFLIFLLILNSILPKKAYFTALFSRAHISMAKCISMKLNNQDVFAIVNAYVLAKKSHLPVSFQDIQAVTIGGGNAMKIVEGLNASRSAKLNFSFEFAKSIDISGRDVKEVVRECLNPKLIELPLISSVAQDNREVNVKISLTLKIDIKNFLAGVAEDTITARAVEAVVTKIANTGKASSLVAQPQLIDMAIFEAKVDEDSKYNLVSADVIHVDLGIDRGLSAEKDQIEKARIINANRLEERRLIAVAEEQEMKVRTEEAKMRLVEEECKVPQTVADSIREGKIKDVADFYKLQNLQADTEMRRKISGNS